MDIKQHSEGNSTELNWNVGVLYIIIFFNDAKILFSCYFQFPPVSLNIQHILKIILSCTKIMHWNRIVVK